jgi:hypothetical protein
LRSAMRRYFAAIENDSEKCAAVFRRDHAQAKT